MLLENQVVSRELAKQLKEAKYKQVGIWWWVRGIENNHSSIGRGKEVIELCELEDICTNFDVVKEKCVAPTVAELGELMPKNIYTIKDEKKPLWHAYCLFDTPDEGTEVQIESAKTEADARAKIWVYLKKKGKKDE